MAHRVAATAGPRIGRTVGDLDPIRDLGVHEAVRPVSGETGLPRLTGYVERAHDDHLRSTLRTARDDTLLLVVGGSSTGKSRACYEALRAVLPRGPVRRPGDDRELLALLDTEPQPGEVVWMDPAQRFLHGSRGGDVVRALHRMLDAPTRPGHPRVVIGGIGSSALRDTSDDREQGVRELVARQGVSVALCGDFDAQAAVRHAAARDPRWRAALAAAHGAHVVPYLAGGPYLVRHYVEGRYDEEAHALLTAAIDVHRTGIRSPLRRALLAEAAGGEAASFDRALHHAVQPVRGVRAIAANREAALVLHGYLAEHACAARRREPIPDRVWAAVTAGVDDDGDAERVVGAALVRGLTQWALPLLRRQADTGDERASRRVAELLHERGGPEAVAELRARARDGCRAATDLLVERHDAGAAELLRALADAGDADAATRLVDLLFRRGGPDAAAQLRERADAGDLDAARRLAELLFADGGPDAVDGLRVRADRGDPHAAWMLVELLAGWRDAEAVAELRDHAARGDVRAASKLVEVLSERRSPEDVAELRALADAGDRRAADHLNAVLVQQEDADSVAELRDRAAGGDRGAARLLDRLLFRQGDEAAATELRGRARDGDRGAAELLSALLCERGDPVSLDELRGRAGRGDGYAAEILVDLLVERGDRGALAELRTIAATGDGYATERLVGVGDPATVRSVRTRARDGDPEAVDMIVEWLDPGDPDAVAELQGYAAAGSGYAAETLVRFLFARGDDRAVAVLRARADDGDGYAAETLVRLLFGRGDPEAVDELRSRAERGDRVAGARLVELLAGRHDRAAEAELGARADRGDRYAAVQLAAVLAGRGGQAAMAELRTRADGGDRCAGERLVELLVGDGGPAAVAELRARADAGACGAARALAAILLARGDEDGLRAEVNAGNTADAARALALVRAER